MATPASKTHNDLIHLQTEIDTHSDHCERTHGTASNPLEKRRSTRTVRWYSRETLRPAR